MKRTTRIAGASTAAIAGSAIVADAGSHDTRMHHRAQLKRACDTCGAVINERCRNLDVLPVKAWMRGFHRGR